MVWSLIYLPFVIVSWVIGGGIGIDNIISYVKNFIFEGSYQTIWFLNALWAATAIVWLLLKKFSPRAIFCMSLPFYLVSCLLSSWYGLLVEWSIGETLAEWYYSFFETTKNGLLFGWTYVALGVWLAQDIKERDRDETEKAFSVKDVVGLVLCMALIVIEWLVRTKMVPGAKGCDIVFSLIPMTALLLKIAATMCLPEKPIWKTMRVYSTLLFLTQRIPLTLFAWVDGFTDRYFGFEILTSIPPLYFVFVLAATFFISFCLRFLSKRMKWLASIY